MFFGAAISLRCLTIKGWPNLTITIFPQVTLGLLIPTTARLDRSALEGNNILFFEEKTSCIKFSISTSILFFGLFSLLIAVIT